MLHLQTAFTDKRGREFSFLVSDGSSLQIRLRGITFVGPSFENLRPLPQSEEDAKTLFFLEKENSLTDCNMLVSIPVYVHKNRVLIDCFLTMEITIVSAEIPIVNRFSIIVDDVEYEVNTKESILMSFEYLLLNLQRKLPVNLQIHCCFFCALSDYPISGSDNYGSLNCFRASKLAILSVKDKSELADLTGREGFHVQETYYCSAFASIAARQWVYKDIFLQPL